MKWASTKKEAQAALDCVFQSIIRALKKEDTVSLVSFGTFKVDRRMTRKGRNPRAGEEVKIRAKKVPKFVPGKTSKDTMKQILFESFQSLARCRTPSCNFR